MALLRTEVRVTYVLTGVSLAIFLVELCQSGFSVYHRPSLQCQERISPADAHFL